MGNLAQCSQDGVGRSIDLSTSSCQSVTDLHGVWNGPTVKGKRTVHVSRIQSHLTFVRVSAISC